MSHYHNRLSEIKKLNIDFLKFSYNDSIISLRVLDESDETVKLLTEWRNIFWDAFYDKFEATEERTKKWIRTHVIDNPERILFMIYLDGKKIGHYGTNRYDANDNSAQLDNLIRGVRGSHPGLIEKIEIAMFRWMFADLNVSKIGGRIWSDNFKVVDLHARCGWRILGRIPYKRIIEGNQLHYEEIELNSDMDFGDRYELVIEMTPNRLASLFGPKDDNLFYFDSFSKDWKNFKDLEI